MTTRVSVVVPTCNRPALLERCLAALEAQDFDPAAFEVIVADDAAAPETEQQVRTRAARASCRVRYLPVSPTHGPAAARNAGWRASEGEIVAFTDDDCLPDPSWLSAGVAAFEGGVAAVSGRVVVPIPDPPTDYERDAAGLERSEFVTANCFCRLEALHAVGGFDERFLSAWREDSDLHFKILSSGGRIARATDAVVVHPVRPAPWGISLRQQRKSLFDALLYKKHPALFRDRIRKVPPWDYYLIVAALLVVLIGVLRGSHSLRLAGTIAWLALTAAFCVRRLRGTTRTPLHVAEMLVTSALIPPVAVFWRIYGALRFKVFYF
jgi:glycosyltransferase involved in cell wall biosynthesis